MSAGGVTIVVTITMMTTAEKMPSSTMRSPPTLRPRPMLAKMRPTSPRGIMPMPTDEPIECPAEHAERAGLLADDRGERQQRGEAEHARLSERGEVDAHAHEHEEHRHEEGGDRMHEVLESAARRGPRSRGSGRRSRMSPAANAPTIGASPTAREPTPSTKQKTKRRREQHAAPVQARGDAEEPRRELQRRAPDAPNRKATALPRTSGDLRRGQRAAPIGRRDDAADDREDHEPEHVVDDRGAEDDARLGVCERPRSCSTRAVMPTLVAVSVAPRNAWT